MSGTFEGGKKAAAVNKYRYGSNFYHLIGVAGGAKSRGGGFTGKPELAQYWGRIGGSKGGSSVRRVCQNGHVYNEVGFDYYRGYRRCSRCYQLNKQRSHHEG